MIVQHNVMLCDTLPGRSARLVLVAVRLGALLVCVAWLGAGPAAGLPAAPGAGGVR